MEGEAEDGDVKDEDVAGRADSLSGSCQKTARVAQRKVPWHKACLADTGCYRHPAATGARAMRMVESPVGDGRRETWVPAPVLLSARCTQARVSCSEPASSPPDRWSGSILCQVLHCLEPRDPTSPGKVCSQCTATHHLRHLPPPAREANASPWSM